MSKYPMRVTILVLLSAAVLCADQPRLYSFIDWGLPACRACDFALLRRAANYPGMKRLSTQIRIPGSSVMNPDRTLSGIVRLVASKTDATPPEPKPKVQEAPKKHERGATAGSPGHIFWIIPAFKVDYAKGFQPLSAKEKFQEWAEGEYDPLGLAAGAAEAATLEHSASDGFCGYGHGFRGYGECFGSLELDATNSSFIGDFVLPVLLHQDPRYFRLGQGSFPRRVWYAVSRVFVTCNDAGHTVFYSSALAGTGIAAVLSNLYYPPQDVGVGHTFSRVAIDLGNTALYNAAAEFWPDIHRKLRRIF